MPKVRVHASMARNETQHQLVVDTIYLKPTDEASSAFLRYAIIFVFTHR